MMVKCKLAPALRGCDNVKVWSTYYILSPVYINKLLIIPFTKSARAEEKLHRVAYSSKVVIV